MDRLPKYIKHKDTLYIREAASDKVAVFAMGLPASGKTSVIKKKYSGLVHVDPDEIKKSINGYDPSNPHKVHQQSIDKADDMVDKLIQEGKSFVFDSTGGNSARYLRAMEAAKEAGYHIKLVNIFVPLEVSLMRNRKRVRFVPEDIVVDILSYIKDTYRELTSSGYVDKAEKISNFTSKEFEVAKKYIEDYPIDGTPHGKRPPIPSYVVKFYGKNNIEALKTNPKLLSAAYVPVSV